ncbi:MAG TPA: CorA family divalent cation transporter, partial [bacterium]|nr:CorA family divalent cation transporter [bacterium]
MLTTFFFKKDEPIKTNLTRAEMLAAHSRKDGLLWVDLETPTEFEEECLIEIFNFHDLAIDDCLNDLSQPKVDDYEEYLFLVAHAASLQEGVLKTTELDVFLGPNYVVTFRKEKIPSVDQMQEQVQKKPDAYMGHGGDTLTYFILDHLVDSYQPVID